MDFNTKYIRYILAVAEFRSFSRAAEQLGVSQPALSLRIQMLEDQVGFSVFDRSKRRLEITEKGDMLIAAFRDLVASSHKAENVVHYLKRSESTALLIGVSTLSDHPSRTRLFTEFSRKYSSPVLEHEAGYSYSLLEKILDGRLELAVVSTPPDGRFDQIPLYSIPTELILPRELPLAADEQITPDKLRGVSLTGFQRERHPALYDKVIQPLVDLGAKPVFGHDRSPSGLLAFAASKRVVIVSVSLRYLEADLEDAALVKRALAAPPVTALTLVRSRHVRSKAGDRLWALAQRLFPQS